MTYQLLKMLHVAAVAAWLCGSLFVSLFLLTSQPQEGEAPGTQDAGALRRWTLFVTTPAMALSWLVGLHLAMSLGWFAMNWIWVKIGIAAVLSALLASRARRWAEWRAAPADGRRRWICMRRSRCWRPRPSSRWRWSAVLSGAVRPRPRGGASRLLAAIRNGPAYAPAPYGNTRVIRTQPSIRSPAIARPRIVSPHNCTDLEVIPS